MMMMMMMMMMMGSGQGHIMREGLQGFARAALAGGIPCLLATKWSIPTKESMMLMTRVYAFMAINKVRRPAGPLRNSNTKDM